jgi:hypothetical protein
MGGSRLRAGPDKVEKSILVGLRAPRSFFTGGNEANEGTAVSLSSAAGRTAQPLFVAFVIFCKKGVGGQGVQKTDGLWL